MTIPLLPGDPHDEALARAVRPPDWVNPTPAQRYHLVVIGGGPAGLVCAAGAAALGARVALIERDLLGGDCLNVGCVPSKALLRAAKAAAEVRRAGRFGVHAPATEVDFPAVMRRVRRVRAELAPADSAERFRSLGVDLFRGEGRFLSDDTVGVNGTVLRFSRCVIATGSRPRVPDLPGLRHCRWYTNETIFTLTELPGRLLVLGGGLIGCEFGQAFARLGSRVTLVARSGTLRTLGPEATAAAQAALTADGVQIVADIPDVDDFRHFEAVLVATGRAPNVEGLNLEAAGVRFDTTGGIAVDDHLRTSNPRVFAAGDVCSVGQRFTHTADAMARTALRNALFPLPARWSTLTIPWCVYTDPEIAGVGLSRAEAAARGIAVDEFRCDLTSVDRAATEGTEGFVSVLVKKGTDRLVGAMAVGPTAGELVGTLALAIGQRVGLKALAGTVFPYPTYTEVLRKLGDRYNRTRLTPIARRLLGWWLRLFR